MAKKADTVEYLGISEGARKFYDKIAKIYAEKIDIKLDFALLAIFARSLEQLNKDYEYASKQDCLFYKTPNGTFAPHPVRDEISMLEKRIESVADALGLSPKARMRLNGKKETGRPKKGLRGKL